MMNRLRHKWINRKWLLPLMVLLLGLPFAQAQMAEPLDPEIAYALSGRWDAANGQVQVRFVMPEGYYLYRGKLQVSVAGGAGQVAAEAFPAGEVHKDEFFGTSEIYRKNVVLPYTVQGATATLTLLVQSQGCADIGVCYPPQEQTITLTDNGQWVAWGKAAGGFSMSNLFNGQKTSVPQGQENAPKAAANVGGGNINLNAAPAQNDGEKLASSIGERGIILSLLVFFGFGLALSLTPCNLPMVPIVGALITSSLKQTSAEAAHVYEAELLQKPRQPLRGLVLAAGFVLGMSITYAAVGSIAGLTGNLLSAQLQLPAVQIASALLMLVLAAGCFGWYTLQLPSTVQTWLHGRADESKQGSFGGLIVSGAISALIVGPCVAAPLAGLLIYIGQQGNAWSGALLLFALAWGQGVPLLAFGLFAGRFMPKLGGWMSAINRFFGFLLVAVAIWFVSPLMPVSWQMAAYGAWLLGSAVFLRALDALGDNPHPLKQVGKALGLLLLVSGLAMWLGLLSGGNTVWPPLAHLKGMAGNAAVSSVNAPEWRVMRNNQELDAAIQSAQGRPVVFDFYADWCVSCKEMEHLTFADAKVAPMLHNMLLLRADVTANNADDKALLKRFGLFGPPAILFFKGGSEVSALRLIGFEDAESFQSRLSRLK